VLFLSITASWHSGTERAEKKPVSIQQTRLLSSAAETDSADKKPPHLPAKPNFTDNSIII
jgi:hypothetical protein